MKKWIGMFLAIFVITFVVVRSVAGEEISKNADFGQVCDESEYFSQIAQCDGKDYVIYSKQEQPQIAWVADVDKNLYQYEALATVHADRVYYVFSYMDDSELNFAVAPVVLGDHEVWETPVFQAEGTLFAAGATEDEIFVSILGNDKMTITEYALPLYYEDYYEWEERVSFSLMEGHYVVAATYEEGELYLLQEDGTVFIQDWEIEEVDMDSEENIFANCFQKGILDGAQDEWKSACKNYAAVKNLPLILLITVFVLFFFYGIRIENHLVYRIIWCSELIGIVVLAFVGNIVEEQLVKHKVLENGTRAGYVLEEMKLEQQADETIGLETYLSTMRRQEDILEDLIIADYQSGEVILSKTMAVGMNLYEYYGEECQVLAKQVADGNQAVMYYMEENGRNNYIVSSRNWSEINSDSLFFAIIPRVKIINSVRILISSVWNTIFLFMMSITVLHMLLFLLFSFRWKRFLSGMEYVATKKAMYKDIPEINDGLYGAWSVLDRIGQNTAKLHYERDILYKKYAPFVPKGIEQLLDKTDISQVKVGDSNKVNGCMIDFCFKNHKKQGEADYRNILNESMQITHKILERYEGIFVTADAKLENRKLFFRGTPANAVSFATDVYLAHSVNKNLAKCYPTLVLQQADYEYGFSGVEENMTPFMYSLEGEISDEHKKLLTKAKVKVVLTEQTYQSLGSAGAVRHLGFVLDEKTKENIRLYESLEVYSKEKRDLMKDCDVIFQKAIILFYTNEFYTARNLFYEVLKLNDEDEVARWYLLRCESFLNKKEKEVTYGLFDDFI